MTPVEILTAARARIERPEAWTQEAYDRDQHGNKHRADAVCWCAAGAIRSIGGAADWQAQYDAMRALHDALGRDALGRSYEGAVIDWNDVPERTHADVLGAFDRAIALAREEAGHVE